MADALLERTERANIGNLEKERVLAKEGHKRDLKEQAKPAPAPAPPKVSAPVLKKAAAAAKEEAKQDRSKHIASKRRQVGQYCARFPQAQFAKLSALPANASEADVDIRLNEIREELNTAEAFQTFNRIFRYGLKFQETVTMRWGYNPAGWNLDGISRLIDAPPQVDEHGVLHHPLDQFEPELSEGAIECSPWLTQPWYMRMAIKIAQFNATYSTVRNNPKLAEPASQKAQDDFEQLGAP